jgi:hypothetical protein
MSDRTALHTSVDRLAGRLRSLPHRRLQAGAAEALELARWLSDQAQILEFPGREPHRLPDDGMYVVGDQLAVAGHDLAVALGSTESRDSRRAATVASEALARVARTAKSLP